MATEINRGHARKYGIKGEDETLNPIIPIGIPNDVYIPIGPNGLLGYTVATAPTDPCHESILECPTDNEATVILIYNGSASQISFTVEAPVSAATFFPGQCVYLDVALSTFDVPVYVVNSLAPLSAGAPDPALFLFIGWTVNAGVAGDLMEVTG